MSDTLRPWPTREEFEARQRRDAEYAIESGDDPCPPEFSGGATYSTEERTEIEALAPVIINMIRRQCGRIERPLRQQYPTAAALARGVHPDEPEDPRWYRHQPDYDSYSRMADRFRAAIDAQDEEDRVAYDTLMQLERVRSDLRQRYSGLFVSPFRHGYPWLEHWPQGYDPPSSPELDRFYAINVAAIQRYQDSWRARGRQMLTDVETGRAWQAQLDHRASVERWFRDGPLITVS